MDAQQPSLMLEQELQEIVITSRCLSDERFAYRLRVISSPHEGQPCQGIQKRAVSLSAYRHQVRIDFSRPGKPTDNGHVETFIGSLRDECLNVHWFESLAEAQATIEAWRLDYNESRPHMALANAVPAEYARRMRLSGHTQEVLNAED